MLPAWILLVCAVILNVQADQSGFISIDCGATNAHVDSTTGLKWVPDDGFIKVGNQATLQSTTLKTVLKALRVFPDRQARKYCYELPVLRNRSYLVRTTYYYGDYDGRNAPPIFEQLIEGTMWTSVNTTMDYSKGLYTYYEVVIASTGKSMSVCLARNGDTIGDPFISAIELRLLESSMYISTDLDKYALALLCRHDFGNSADKIVRYPDDPYDRIWQSFQDSHNNVSRNLTTSTRGLLNIPPPKVLETALTTEKVEPMEIQWTDQNLENKSYYIALYFPSLDIAEPQQERVFNISINGINFSSYFNVSMIPRMVDATDWTLSGPTSLLLTPVSQSSLGPIISAGELFEIVSLGGRTITRDVIALNLVKQYLINVPSDWHGDPCLPVGYSWTGISCSGASPIRVQILNLTSAGLSGSLSPRIADLTALTHIWLGNNNLSGPIPDLVSLKLLTTLHLEGNKFSGNIPISLGQLTNLSELFLQFNDLSGQIPNDLSNNTKINLGIRPGNPLLVN